MAQSLRSLPSEIKNAPLVVPTRSVMRVEDINFCSPSGTTIAHYTIGAACINAQPMSLMDQSLLINSASGPTFVRCCPNRRQTWTRFVCPRCANKRHCGREDGFSLRSALHGNADGSHRPTGQAASRSRFRGAQRITQEIGRYSLIRTICATNNDGKDAFIETSLSLHRQQQAQIPQFQIGRCSLCRTKN